MSDQALNSGDSDDLEALFDSIVQANHSAPAPAVAAPAPAASAPASLNGEGVADMAEPARTMFTQIGQLTRKLHDTLRELGLDKSLEKAASQIPDARDRLSYVANMTEQAAERTLNALDAAKPLQDGISDTAKALSGDWDKLFAKQLSVDEFKQLVARTRTHLTQTQTSSDQISSQMLEIMMAQDFQDLTGQVIKKILTMSKEMETHLLEFLLTFSPQGARDEGLLNGPVVNTEGRTDVVTNQEQVDDLLESLGF
ncbi:protein phosphatase CheZ [Amantichitinum ursilacus]|uniref:Protein phosphatase CheZ n=1 Tax=Amantichitinum ursilacus TaxID=857265 RepID=A0A0N0GNS0_9NEIS|nr:protein phosphatase CheZ [Amantichitinum ursilacus]KPC53104.1 chemotaxis regulator CheZ [Amantichitinum ursilacus]